MKLFKLIITLIVVITLITAGFEVLAVNDLSFNGIISFQLNTIDAAPVLTSIVAGSTIPPIQQVSSLTVNTNNILLSVDAGSSITFNTTAPGRYLYVTHVSGSASYSLNPGCITSQVTIIGTGTTANLRLTVSSTPPGCAGPVTPPTSGGVGHIVSEDIFPSNFSVSINNGNSCTSSSLVILDIVAENAEDVVISNDMNFVGTSWETFANPMQKTWNLEPGSGTKKVYVRFRSPTGDYSTIASDSITLDYAGCEEEPFEPDEPSDPTLPDGTVPGPGGSSCQPIICQNVTYDLYIINPDGTIRSSTNGYTSIISLEPDVFQIGYEDSGTDFDYNDIVMELDKRDCSNLKITNVGFDAGWHHEIRIILNYKNRTKDILLWEDSHTSVGKSRTISMYDYDQFCESATVNLLPGSLIKGSLDAVYYYGTDGKRHVFPNRRTYDSHYNGDFSRVIKIPDLQLAGIQLGYNMTYKPGVRMIKIQSDPKVYAVDTGAVLRFVTTEAVARALYGSDWSKYIDDLNPAFFTDYTVGAPVAQVGDYPEELLPAKKAAEEVPTPTPEPEPEPEEETPVVVIEPDNCTTESEFIAYMELEALGQEVRQLQTLLKCLGYFPATQDTTAYFGPVTEEAVKKFQTAKDIASLGYVGDATLAALNKYVLVVEPEPEPEPEPEEETPPVVIEPDNCTNEYTFTVYMELEAVGEEVRQLQALLQCLGYFPQNEAPTAYFGPVTEEAVIKFQEAKNIDGVGYVGPETREALNKY